MSESNRNKSWPNHAGSLTTLSVGAAVLALVLLMDDQPATQGADGAGVVAERVVPGSGAEGDTSEPTATPQEIVPTF